MKKSLVLLAFLSLLSIAGCSISGLNPFGGGGDVIGTTGGLCTLAIEILNPSRGTIDLEELPIMSASFRITDALAGVQNTNWVPGSAAYIMFNPVVPGLTTLRLQDVDSAYYTNVIQTNVTLVSGYNYRILVSLGGAIYMIETNYAPYIAARDNMVFSESHADTNVWTRGTFLYVWTAGTVMNTLSAASYEGVSNWQIVRGPTTLNWLGFGVDVTNAATNMRDFSLYSAGHVNFAIKNSNTTITYKVGLKSVYGTTTNERWVSLSNRAGYAADGNWHVISIPMSEFSGINFGSLVGVFYFSTDYPIPIALTNTTITVYLDDVYLSRD